MNEKRLRSRQPVKAPGRTLIGVDLDNTLVCYDELFHSVARQEGLIEPSAPKSKEQIRDAIRLLPQGESKWTRLQAIVYGAEMSGATAFEFISTAGQIETIQTFVARLPETLRA